jgi:hypothetical protein
MLYISNLRKTLLCYSYLLINVVYKDNSFLLWESYDLHIVTCMSDSQRGFGSEIGFIDHVNTQLVIKVNYSAIANFHTLQIATAHAKHFPGCSVFTNCSLVTASNSGDSSASALKSPLNVLPAAPFLHRLPYRTDLVAPNVFFITP